MTKDLTRREFVASVSGGVVAGSYALRDGGPSCTSYEDGAIPSESDKPLSRGHWWRDHDQFMSGDTV